MNDFFIDTRKDEGSPQKAATLVGNIGPSRAQRRHPYRKLRCSRENGLRKLNKRKQEQLLRFFESIRLMPKDLRDSAFKQFKDDANIFKEGFYNWMQKKHGMKVPNEQI